MNLELKDTVEGMLSEDYVERFRAEYYQLMIRYKKLEKMLIKLEAGTLDFEPTCPLEVLKDQLGWMEQYRYTLEVRAEIEGILL